MKYTAITLFTLSAFTACGDEAEDTVERALQNDFDIIGEWETACRGVEILSLDSPHAVRRIDLSTDKEFRFQQSFYGSDACQDKAMNFKIEGDYDVVGKNDSNSDLRDLNLSVKSATLTVNSDAFVEAMNLVSFCGKDDWVMGQEQDITGHSCAGMKVEKDDLIKEVYLEKDDEIYFSSQFYFPAKNILQERPTQVDMSVPYTEK